LLATCFAAAQRQALVLADSTLQFIDGILKRH